MPLFTFITDYSGGTYISQHSAPNLRAACDEWLEHTRRGNHIPGLNTEQLAAQYFEDIEAIPPVPIQGLQNIWYFSVLMDDDAMVNHIIATNLVASMAAV